MKEVIIATQNSGKAKEFEHIFKYHYIDIYNFIYHYIMNGDYSEDLAQDVFICFFEKRIK